jgi:hypothetical protein
MNIAGKITRTTAAIALALPVAALQAQITGVSHPDDTPITNSETQQQAYQPLPAAVATESLKPRPGVPMEAASVAAPTFTVIGQAEPLPAEISAKPDIDAGIVTRVPGPSNELPVGTLIKINLGTGLSTVTTASGTGFTGQLMEAVLRDGHVMLPAGSTLTGSVTDIHGGRRVSGAASIHLRLESVTLPDGTSYQLRGQVVDTGLFRETKIDREGTIRRRDHAAKTAATFALSAGGGAAAGAMVAGVPGALVGAGVGAGVSTAVWLKQDRQLEIPAGTRVVFGLNQPLALGQR